ncbi:hypothetical protein NDU88_002027 [Pleurodeles waltl]|uniref:Uncharacterized protein n=1 Tax=Pleurodeles waltl TaxID=8319 RepID=A0AAV7SBR3_PLEWA|nr:hypothetical protein NDU88_002027 [Pleurodeles waltl]
MKSKSQGPMGQASLALHDQTPKAATPVVPEGMSDTLNKILGVTEDSKRTLQQDIDKVSTELGLLRADHQKRSDKVHEMESTRAHRVPARRPRPVVAEHLHYCDRDLLLQRARAAGPFKVKGGQASLFQDFTVAVKAKKDTFTVVKRVLREEGMTYALLFPSRLKPMVMEVRTSSKNPRKHGHGWKATDRAWLVPKNKWIQ